jgi:hypothetical protein
VGARAPDPGLAAPLTVLGVDPAVLAPGLAAGCTAAACDGACCATGAWVDLAERDAILTHAALVRRHLDPHQDPDPGNWFGPVEVADADCPSGRRAHTATTPDGCIFLDRRRRCVLQTAAAAEGLHRHALKPFRCVAFPLTVAAGVVRLATPAEPARPACCGRVPGGPVTPLEAWREELAFVLGAAGLAALERERRRWAAC